MIQLVHGFIIRSILQKPFRFLLTFLSIVFGVGLFVSIELINEGTISAFRQNVDAVAGRTQLMISAGSSGIPDTALAEIEKFDGVKNAVPVIEARGRMKSRAKGGGTIALTIMGVDLLREQAVRSYKSENQEVIDDPLEFFNQEDSIIVTRPFADQNGLKLEDSFEVLTVNGYKHFAVRGILEPSGPAKAFGGSLAIMDIDAANFTFGKQGRFDRIDIVPMDGYSIDQLTQQLKQHLGAAYEVQRPDVRSAQVEKMIRSFQAFLSIIGGFAWIVGLFLIFNSVHVSVAQRRREIGIMRAIGASRFQVMGLFLGESLLIGLAGSALGLWIGEIAADHMVRVVVQTLSIQFQTDIDLPQLTMSAKMAWIVLILGSLSTLVAAFFPSLHASRIEPLQAIKSDDELRSQNVSEDRWKSMAWLGLALACFVVVLHSMGWVRAIPGGTYLAQVGVIFGVILVAPSVVLFCLNLSGRLAERANWVAPRLAINNLKSQPTSLLSNIGAMALALHFILFISTTTSSILDSADRFLNRIVYWDVLVSAQGDLINYDVQVLDASIGDRLRTTVGPYLVDNLDIIKYRTALVPFEGEKIRIHAKDAGTRDPEVLKYHMSLIGDDAAKLTELFHSNEPVLAASTSFLKRFKRKVGDSLTFDLPFGQTKFRIIGAVDDMTHAQGALYMSLGNFQKTWRDKYVTQFLLKLKNQKDAGAVKALIENSSGDDGLMALLSGDVREEIKSRIKQAFLFTHPIQISAVIVAFVGLLSSMLVRALARMREIGVLRSLGATKSQLFQILLFEALIQGILSLLVALVLSLPIIWIWIEYLLPEIMGWDVALSLPIEAYFIVAAVGFAVAALAGVIPAYRVAKRSIQEVLQYE